ncbi:DNA-directed RNA polymerase subunit D [Candidatus Pacearchaeota archaeon]|nr:DNA-directed RNA polymerase subunit D [Candidatus Pacearchaeota archaeon]
MEAITNTKEKLVLRGQISESLANAIRRSVSEIPVLAIDEVEIYKNDSALYDEVLAHRLGLIPLVTEKSMTSKTKIDFKLTKEGPCTVYSKDLKGAGDIVFNNIPITILGEGHKLELVATAVLGKGINHAKFVPGLCFYRHLLEVKSSPEADKIVQGFKFALIKPEKQESKWICDLNDLEADKIRDMDKSAVIGANEILLIIESYGNLPAKDILTRAIEALSENLDEFEKFINKNA